MRISDWSSDVCSSDLDGTVTAANSSSISDGASSMVLMRESTAKKLGATPLARIVAHTQHSQEPGWFTTAPVGAIQKLFAKTAWPAEQVDLYEIKETFAIVTAYCLVVQNLPTRQDHSKRSTPSL